MRDSFQWTEYEDGILLEAVKEAKSVKEGIIAAAEILDTTFHVCRNRWYKHLQFVYRKDENDIRSPVATETIDESYEHSAQVENVKNSLEDFLSDLSKLVEDNKRLLEENMKLKRENRILMNENREIKEAYDYMLKIINKAREMCLQDENRPPKLKYNVSANGLVETVTA